MIIRKVGVEEEMFLVDPSSRRLVPVSGRVTSGEDDVEQELFLQQLETQSDPHRDLADVAADLREARRKAAAAAESAGARLAVMPTPVLPGDDGDVTPNARYHRMMRRFGEVGRRALACGMHVHVDVADDEEAVAVIDALRPWLPLVQAISAGSPFDSGIDTGYASWRAQVWEAWPSAGVVEPFGDAAGYRAAVEALIASGAALDEGMIYLDARPARAYPTVEIRVADVCTDLRDTVLVAAVARALVTTCAEDWKAGRQPEAWRVDLLRAARWRARHDGLGGVLLDPLTRRPVPAADALATLVRTIEPALIAAGDHDLVTEGIARVLRDGGGAQRQRAAAGEDLDLVAVVDDVLARTAASFDDD
ncbi:carboxylate-amine ligase [Aeromicrobium wangtongii]|uniref:Putative glutamate--cysteine ligase 2 n=1 Tax=Aeromicrobium wangtongii TaxID=2969247 RepID=A0ABY5M4X2_9ACTN|nr:glutamate--cysteine ligase [Aeromicrobium wangtongii]MCD9198739.1 glutamate--cysteine ligase [Aeromicrobium wangtongii]UUP13215.1 glutamate--cysteine ligase [Aeromicrobium wangtongii]